MEIKKLIKELQECLKEGKTHLTLLANATNGEDTDFDMYMNDLEVWKDGEETATLFMSNITELDVNGEPINHKPKRK
tara:strand:+ start:651 stop:881 length:231 start_codon:yes stop_codon:yes gene_type:complete